MKQTLLKNLFLSNAPLVTISLILGYSFWYIASYNQIVTLQVNVPLCFSNTAQEYDIQAPEKVAVTLQGKRSDIYTLEEDSLAAHIDTHKLLPGKHGIILKDHHLFLPHNIMLVNYKPANLALTIIEKEKL